MLGAYVPLQCNFILAFRIDSVRAPCLAENIRTYPWINLSYAAAADYPNNKGLS